MKIKDFIKQLEDISKNYGEELDVIMADNEPIVKVIFSDKYFKPSVVVTDRD